MSLSRLCSRHGMCVTEVGPGSIPDTLHQDTALNNYSWEAPSRDQDSPGRGHTRPHRPGTGHGGGRGQRCCPGLARLSSLLSPLWQGGKEGRERAWKEEGQCSSVLLRAGAGQGALGTTGEDQDQCSWLWVEELGTLAAHCSPCSSSLPEWVPTRCSAEQNSSMHPALTCITPDSLITTKKAQDGPGAHGHSLGQSHKCPQAGESPFPCTGSHCCQDSAPAPGSSSNSPRQCLQ